MNQLVIIGNAVRDAELKSTQSKVQVCTFTVAVNGRKAEDVTYFRCTAWRQLADICGKYITKGKKVCVIGPVSVSTYKGKDGETKASLEVTVDEMELLSASEHPTSKPEPLLDKGFIKVDEDLPF